LLAQQREYLKQRGRIKRATLRDENMKFFHANATVRHNKNSIMVLKNSEGQERCSHEDKTAILWEAYKERLGPSEFTQIYFDLNELL
jgi:hypothetical protein